MVMMNTFKKNDFILVGILLIGFLFISGFLHFGKRGGAYAVVSVDGKEVISFSLKEDIVYEIKGYDGGSNTLIIRDGKAHLTDSSCPDHLCEYMGEIDQVGQSIICLPNRIVVEIRENGVEATYDTISS